MGIDGPLPPPFPDEIRRNFDEFAWRVGRVLGKTGSGYVGSYFLVFHSRIPNEFDRSYGEYNITVRFAIYHAVPREAVLVVNNRDHVIEWGPEGEIQKALEFLRKETLLDELASL